MRQNWVRVNRSKEERNDVEEKQEARKVRRKFTPEQKSEIFKDIERGRTIKEGLESIGYLILCIGSGSGNWKSECVARCATGAR
jgi:hypothetical protein